MSKNFEELWEFARTHCDVLAQDKKEMEHVFNLIKDSESYLEVGTSEGNSLYIFGHALKKGSEITYVDLAEAHTQPYREEKLRYMKGYTVHAIHGNSHDPQVIKEAQKRKYDCVFIDAGHTYNDAIYDARFYAPLATKYVFFHDVQLPEVMGAYKQWQLESGMKGYEIINSLNYGYGVIKV